MRIIKVGNTFRTYDDSLETFDKLPAQNYVVRFQKNSGFFLEKYADIEIKEKTYGVHMSKVEKVLKAFPKAEKNLGVILSGNKESANHCLQRHWLWKQQKLVYQLSL